MRNRPLLRSRARISALLASAMTGIIALAVTGAAPGAALASAAIHSVMPHV